MKTGLLFSLPLAAAMTLAANAAVTDDFESYTLGSNLSGEGDWEGWKGDAGAGAIVSGTYAASGAQSVNITGTSDLVHKFSGITSGEWVFSIKQYIKLFFSFYLLIYSINSLFLSSTDVFDICKIIYTE